MTDTQSRPANRQILKGFFILIVVLIRCADGTNRGLLTGPAELCERVHSQEGGEPSRYLLLNVGYHRAESRDAQYDSLQPADNAAKDPDAAFRKADSKWYGHERPRCRSD